MLVYVTVLRNINWISEGCLCYDSAVFGHKEVSKVVDGHIRQSFRTSCSNIL